jgi:ParB-like chromosome segregation protein Spo0J
MNLEKTIRDELTAAGANAHAVIESIRDVLHSLSPVSSQPVDRVRWVPIEKVSPNDYNPNSVARVEMRLLYTSIKHDGYTQPIVTVYDPEKDQYIIVDGFHRYYVAKTFPEILERNGGLLPVVVIDKPANDRMASTIRHNRARGKHSIAGMSSIVFKMLENGWADADICNELGMEAEELLRLKHMTGFAKLFQGTEYRKAWISKNQIIERKKYEAAQREKDPNYPGTGTSPAV